MSAHATDDPDDQRVIEYPRSDLESEVVEYHDEPPQCTIYPADADVGTQLTTWISARGDSFVDLAEQC